MIYFVSFILSLIIFYLSLVVVNYVEPEDMHVANLLGTVSALFGSFSIMVYDLIVGVAWVYHYMQ